MLAMHEELDQRTEAMNADMEAMGKRIGDHDQVIRTYFIRVIETFGVFVGIFAIVVVMMLNRYEDLTQIQDPWTATILAIGKTAAVVIAVLVMLLGIKYLILQPDRSR